MVLVGRHGRFLYYPVFNDKLSLGPVKAEGDLRNSN